MPIISVPGLTEEEHSAMRQQAQEKPAAPSVTPTKPGEAAPASARAIIKPVTEPSTSEDVGKSFLAGAGLGLTSDIVGLPGAIVSGIHALTGSKYEPKPETVPPQDYTRNLQMGGPQAGATPFGAIAAAQSQPISPEEATAKTQEVLPFTKYQPRTTLGGYAKAAGEVGAGMITGGPKAVISGMGAGFLGHGIGEFAGRELGEQYRMPAELIGTLGTGILTHQAVDTTAKLFAPKSFARDELVRAYQADLASGDPATRARLNPDQIQASLDSGRPVTMADAGGQNVRNLLLKYGKISPSATASTESLIARAAENSQFNVDRPTASVDNFINQFDTNYGHATPAELLKAKQTADAPVLKALYDAARKNSAATSVWSSELEELMKSKPIQDAMAKADEVSTYRKDFVGYTPGTPSRTIVQQPQGFQTIPGSPPTYPNLFYWDEVKKKLGDQVTKAAREGGSDYQGLSDLKSRLVKALDDQVPEYAQARAAAGDSFEGKNALEAGGNTIKKLDNFDEQKLLSDFNKMSPDNQDLFRQGALGAIRDIAKEQGLSSLENIFKKEGRASRLREILGPDQYNDLYGLYQREKVLSGTYKMLSDMGPRFAAAPSLKSGIGPLPSLGLLGGAGIEAAQMVMPKVAEALGDTGTTLAAGSVVAGVLGVLKKVAVNAREQRIAGKVADLISDPSKTRELGALAANNRDASNLLARLAGPMIVGGGIINRPDQSQNVEKPKTIPIQPEATENANDTIADRANNWGAMMAGDFAKNQPGYAGTLTTEDKPPRVFAKFDTMEHGRNAAGALLDQKIAAGLTTPYDLIKSKNGWDHTAKMTYPLAIAKALGIGIRDKINYTPENREKILDAIHQVEAGHGEMHRPQRDVNVTLGPPIRASGGRIERASGGSVNSHIERLTNRLTRALAQAKVATDEQTKPLLDMPDEHIVKALAIANKAI